MKDQLKSKNKENVSISRNEYRRLKRLEKVDTQLLMDIAESLEDIKQGRIECVA